MQHIEDVQELSAATENRQQRQLTAGESGRWEEGVDADSASSSDTAVSSCSETGEAGKRGEVSVGMMM
jgi:hypothetical protein